MPKETHKTRCLEYMKEHDSITSLQAIQDLGNTRLAQTIFQLKGDGHEITTQTIEVGNRWGGTTHVTKYTLSTSLTLFQKIKQYGKGL
tara:strand:+ start:2021 stop:2284 length:264 start_codon:yes stop_codon:yes gene_type:complete